MGGGRASVLLPRSDRGVQDSLVHNQHPPMHTGEGSGVHTSVSSLYFYD